MSVKFVTALNRVLEGLLRTDPRVYILGEDIIDPYGGAFKVTRGLSTQYPGRVITTPVSEAAITGVCAGMALRGMRPILEVMFGDFMTLTFDQVLNHITKFEKMYNHKAKCPVIIRTPFGGGRGYGPTHSQSLEKHFLGIPHLDVVAPSLYHDLESMFNRMLAGSRPVLFVEHKLMYPQILKDLKPLRSQGWFAEAVGDGYSTISLSLVPPSDCSLTLLAYGYRGSLLEDTIKQLAVEEEIFCHLLIPSLISPVNYTEIIHSVELTGRLLVIEEGVSGWSWGSEIAAEVQRLLFGRLKAPIVIASSASDIIPNAKDLERQVLVSPELVAKKVKDILNG